MYLKELFRVVVTGDRNLIYHRDCIILSFSVNKALQFQFLKVWFQIFYHSDCLELFNKTFPSCLNSKLSANSQEC